MKGTVVFIFVSKNDDVNEQWMILHKEWCDLYRSQIIIRVIKARKYGLDM